MMKSDSLIKNAFHKDMDRKDKFRDALAAAAAGERGDDA